MTLLNHNSMLLITTFLVLQIMNQTEKRNQVSVFLVIEWIVKYQPICFMANTKTINVLKSVPLNNYHAI